MNGKQLRWLGTVYFKFGKYKFDFNKVINSLSTVHVFKVNFYKFHKLTHRLDIRVRLYILLFAVQY